MGCAQLRLTNGNNSTTNRGITSHRCATTSQRFAIIALAGIIFAGGFIAAVQMRRLQIETRRWILSNLLPRNYCKQMGLDHQGDGFNFTVVTGVPESFASLGQKRLKIG
jgi:hypothetical protein